jgi:hypothetical protein
MLDAAAHARAFTFGNTTLYPNQKNLFPERKSILHEVGFRVARHNRTTRLSTFNTRFSFLFLMYAGLLTLAAL